MSYLLKFAALSLLTAAVVRPGTAAAQARLSLAEALNLAREKNRDLAVARLETNRVDAQIREAKGEALPTLTAAGSYLHHFQKPVAFFPGSFGGDPTISTPGGLSVLRTGGDNAFVGNVQLTQPLLSAQVFSALRSARLTQDRTGAALDETRAQVVTDVRKSYYAVLLNRELLRIQQQRIVRNQRALRDQRNLLQVGRASAADTLRAFVTVENLRPEAIRLANQVQIAQTELQTLLGLDPRQPVELTDSLRYEPRAERPDEEQAYAQALTRPGVRQLEVDARLSREAVRYAGAARVPQLSLVGLAQVQSQSDDLRLRDYQWPVSSYAGVQVAAPLFNGLRTNARVQQQRVGLLQSEKRLEQLREQIRAEVKTALSGVEEARRRIEVQQKTVASAELSLRLTNDRLRQGRASQLDFSDAELALTEARVNYIQAVRDYLSAEADLDLATGLAAR